MAQDKISTTQQKVDPDKFSAGSERIFGKRCPKHAQERLPCKRCKEPGQIIDQDIAESDFRYPDER